MHDNWSRFIVFHLRNPHLLECGQASQNAAANPNRIFSLWWRNNFNFHGAGCQSCYFFLNSVGHAWKHCAAAGKNRVRIEVLADVHVAAHDGVIGGFVDSRCFHSYTIEHTVTKI